MRDDRIPRITPLTWDWDRPPEPNPVLLGGYPGEIWLGRLPSAHARQQQLRGLLSADEQARLARFRRPADQQRFLTTRGLLRMLLGARLRQSPQSLTLRAGPHGKPFVELAALAAPLHFNVSHSGDFVLIALSTTHEVGADIEQEHPISDLAALAARVFAASDYHAWAKLPVAEQEPAFFQLWTRHEAGLKALGHGFASASAPATTATLTWFDLNLPAGYAGSAAIKSD